MGREVKRFERKLAAYLEVPYVVMTNSGSSAALLAFSAYRQLYGTCEFVFPAVNWPTTLWAAHLLGFGVSLVDIDLETLCLTADAWQNGEAVCGVYLMGSPECVWSTIGDACEAFGEPSDVIAVGHRVRPERLAPGV